METGASNVNPNANAGNANANVNIESARQIVNVPKQSANPTGNAPASSNVMNSQRQANTNANVNANVGRTNNPSNVMLTENQFRQLLGNLHVNQDTRAIFSKCSVRFNGGRNTSKIEDFIATILVYKDAENISDELALLSLPLLLEGYASSWWQGVKEEAETFNDAIDLLRKAFSPPKPDWRIFSEISQEKQKFTEPTDVFICRKRQLFAQLSEKLSEKTMINMIFSQLVLKIREKIPRESVGTFSELLDKAREAELLLGESKEVYKAVDLASNSTSKIPLRCSYCRKKNHSVENCFKKMESEKKTTEKMKETTLSCYGCGTPGYYRSNCPNCNQKNPLRSPEKLDFNTIQTTVIGRNVPTVDININGLKGEAYLDTAARTSVASSKLYEKLKEKGVEFQKVFAEIKLADGIPRQQMVYSTIVDIIIGKRFKRIRFICLANAENNRTLLGIDFLEQAGIVMDLAQRTWHFKDDANTMFEFKMQSAEIKHSLSLSEANIRTHRENHNPINDFMSWFENTNSSFESSYEYSPREIRDIFAGSIPENYEIPEQNDLFPPMKRVKKSNKAEGRVSCSIDINSVEIRLRPNEGAALAESERTRLQKLLEAHKEIFEETTVPIPHMEHHIKTEAHAPISSHPYRISPAMKNKLKIELEDMLKKGIIEESKSPWSFPVVLIPKKDGGVRFCVDYRRLNAITTTDTYPLPRMDDLLHAAKATPFMSTIDLKAGYWQIKMAPAAKPKTAFTTPFGIFVFNRMPFGLKNAPATFQRLIDKFRSELPHILILAYLDDIIICSNDFNSHMQNLRQTLSKIKEYGFQLNRGKCVFCREEIKYLGHILTTKGLKVDNEKAHAVLKRPNPKNLKQLVSFLQTCSWYRRFIPNFADVAKPLSQLTKKNAKWRWSAEEQNAFDRLKDLLSSPPVLQQVDETKPFILKTDASDYALGAVLLQGENEEEHPIEYARRLLLAAERNYSTTEREALAIVWALQKFRGYVEGSEITVLTDHQPLKWLFSLKTPTGRLARWALQLQMYNLKLGYTAGKQNVVADMLSRPPCCPENKSNVNSFEIDFPRKGAEEFRKEQLKDEELKYIIESFEKDDENVTRHTNRGYMMVNGVLHRFCSDEDSENGQLVVPKSLRETVLIKFHVDPTAGHYGIDRTTSRITPLYFWPGMRADISQYVKSCVECKKI
ncbi:uncharacterized protein LOC118755602 [Rhagoletis pomonella]|uniref:uncharacterized protein LOC118755602 n=1 Tax=Rhagoletis pomonella TaxID=28610 RepID=UPI00178675AB|nr:uncharacterized protein LOC118755602 [Rhagoletis pomonella]